MQNFTNYLFSRLIFSYFWFILIFLNACSPQFSSKTEIGQQFNLLDKAWKDLQNNDKQILININKISNIAKKGLNFDKHSLDSIRIWQKELQKRRFSQSEMQQSNHIDEYDLALLRLISLTEKLKNSVKDNAEIEAIWLQIKQQDQNAIIKRTDYDLVADKINTILTKSPQKLEGKYKNLQKIPVFRITE